MFGAATRMALLEDKISTLPDDILLTILSLMTFKEAVATGILSRRWRYLWASLPVINFRFEYFLQREGDIRYRNSRRHSGLLEDNKDRFVQMVNQVLRFRKGQVVLEEFGIHYPLRESSACHVDLWVAFALAVGVSKLELNFSTYLRVPKIGMKNYSIPPDVFDGTKVLLAKLDRCFPSIPTSSSSLNVQNGFKSLKELSLECVDLTDEDFEAILSSCTSLERLHLLESNKLVKLKHTRPHTKLKCLAIYHCPNVEKVEIFAPNLASFLYRGAKIHIFVKDAKRLANLCVHSYGYVGVMEYPPNNHLGLPNVQAKDFFFAQFADYLSHLEHLTLDISLFLDKQVFNNVLTLSNLKYLSLTSDNDSQSPRGGVVSCYHTVVFLVKASPFLHRLDLHFNRSPSENPKLRRVPMSPHKHLKELLVSGFYGNGLIMDLIMSISEFAIELQKVEITMAYLGDLSWVPRSTTARDAKEVDVARKSIGQLRQKLPANVQLCSLDRIIYGQGSVDVGAR